MGGSRPALHGVGLHSCFSSPPGVRMISLSYSRISLADIAQKLQLDSPEDAEFIVAKVSVQDSSSLCLLPGLSFPSPTHSLPRAAGS